MTDIPSTADVTPAAPPASQPDAVQEGMLRIVWRWSRRLLAVGVAAIATATVMSLTIDLGRFPVLRERAQEAASKYLERPVHIGAVHALLTPGTFAIDDFRIEGTPDSRPFFTAKRITVSLSWRTLLRRELVLNVTLDDWTMAVESWPGRTNMPPGLRRKREPSRRKIFNKTTVDFVHARRGQFVFDDHGLPWTVVAPNLDFSLVPYAGQYIGTARFSGGTVKIQDYLPMSTALSTRFALKGGLVELRHLDLLTDGAESHINGAVDFGNWPAQT